MLPQIRLQPWYPGQFGVPGSDVPRGLRWRSSGVVFYVDTNHPNATAFADGTDPENPISTITNAFARLAAFHAEASISAVNSVIVIAPGTYTESINIAQTTYPDYCTILGGGNDRYPVIWQPLTADALTIDAYGWLVDGIHFLPGATGAGVKLTRTAGTAGAEGTVIQNCFFNGGWGTGLYGVELEGAPANVSILGCRFAEFGSDSPAITVTDTSTADPYQTHIIGNTFQECDEYIARDCAGGWNQTLIAQNFFPDATHDAVFPGGADGTDMFIDMRAGKHGYNTVTGNCLGGTYSNAGGYYAGVADNWIGNIAEDVASPQVGDNGFTIALPV